MDTSRRTNGEESSIPETMNGVSICLDLQMLLRVFALHHSLHHPPGALFVPKPDTHVDDKPRCHSDEKKDQDFSGANDEVNHGLFPLFEPNKWDTAATHIHRELSIPLL